MPGHKREHQMKEKINSNHPMIERTNEQTNEREGGE